jgi:hypothetical protein
VVCRDVSDKLGCAAGEKSLRNTGVFKSFRCVAIFSFLFHREPEM